MRFLKLNYDRLKWKYGVTGICMLPGMSKWQIAPDGLHCILNIHALLWELVSTWIFTYNFQDRLVIALKAIGLHSIVCSVQSLIRMKLFSEKSLKNLKLKGPVCLSLELHVVRLFLTLTNGTFEMGPCLIRMKGIMIAYMKFNQLARILRSTNLSDEQADTFYEKALLFSENYIQHLLGASSINSRCYLHVLVECMPRYIKFWHAELGIGPAVWSTSCGESKNMHCYEGEQNHCNMSADSMIQVMEYDLRSCSYCPISQREREQTCTNCYSSGHNKKNKSCTEHSDSRTHTSFPQLEETLSNEEKDIFIVHQSAFIEYFQSTKKELIKTMIETYLFNPD